MPVSGTVPHPFFFNRARSINGVTSCAAGDGGPRQRDVGGADPAEDDAAVFGGPSFDSVKQTVVSDDD